jgi:hypothetical protein
MWTYEQWTGRLLHDGSYAGSGYSGHAEGKNNPEHEKDHAIGPIPQGWYKIGPPKDTKTHGPYVLELTPAPENEMYGRSGFLIHGDSIKKPGTASQGCIILVPALRIRIWKSEDTELTVVPGERPGPPAATS